MNELKWQRTQLLRIQAQQKAKQGGAGAKKPVPKVTQGPVKKVGPTRQPPKLGAPKSATASKASSVVGGKAAPAQAKKNIPNGVPAKPAAAKAPAKAPAKATAKMNGVAK